MWNLIHVTCASEHEAENNKGSINTSSGLIMQSHTRTHTHTHLVIMFKVQIENLSYFMCSLIRAAVCKTRAHYLLVG
jgi:hypothetical protein